MKKRILLTVALLGFFFLQPIFSQQSKHQQEYDIIIIGIEDYERLAAPVMNRLFFAGEATSISDANSVHGAYQSGIDAARQIKSLSP